MLEDLKEYQGKRVIIELSNDASAGGKLRVKKETIEITLDGGEIILIPPSSVISIQVVHYH